MGENLNYLRRQDAADYLKTKYGHGSPATLAKLASVGGGPSYQKYGRYPVYTRECLDKWALDRLTRMGTSTSDLAVA